MTIISILHSTTVARIEHGLQHSDYERYRKYCSKKIKSLVKVGITKARVIQTGAGTGTGTGVDRLIGTGVVGTGIDKLEAFDFENELFVNLFRAEKAWAFANEIRFVSQALEKRNESAARKHFAVVKRLRRAAQFAEKVAALAGQGDEPLALQAKAYVAIMNGHLLVETREWQRAQDVFLQARKVYQQLVLSVPNPNLSQIRDTPNKNKVKDNYKLQTLCQAAIDDLDPNIRLCGYGLGRVTDLDDLLDLALTHPTMDRSLLETRLAQSETIVWVDEITIRITDQAVLAAALLVQPLAKALNVLPHPCTFLEQPHSNFLKKSNLEKDFVNECIETRLRAYDKLLNALFEVETKAFKALDQTKIAKETYKVATSKTNDDAEGAWQFSHYSRIMASVSRTEFLICVNRSLMQQSKERDKDVVALALENIKLSRAIVKAGEEMAAVKYVDNRITSITTAIRQTLQAASSIEFARWYLAQGQLEKAISVACRAKRTVEEAGESGDSGRVLISERIRKVTLDIDTVEALGFARLSLVQEQRGAKNPVDTTRKALFENMHAFDAFTGLDLPLLVGPPEMQPIPFRPIFYDTAFDMIKFPESVGGGVEMSLEQELPPGKEATGLVQGLFGGLWS